MKKAWMPITPSLHASAKMSASPTPSALIAWLPWMKVSARSRSRSTAASSKSMFSAAASICAPSLAWTWVDLPARNVLRVADQFGIARLVDPPDARRRAALDLVEQARPVARLEEAVGARAQQEQLLQRVERVVDRSRAGERAVIIALRAPRAAMLLDAREIVIGAQQDEREALIVAQQHVVGGADSA